LEERLVRKKASHDLLLLLYFSGLVIDFHGLQHNMNSGPIMGEKKNNCDQVVVIILATFISKCETFSVKQQREKSQLL
jgi:hypothetical protein